MSLGKSDHELVVGSPWSLGEGSAQMLVIVLVPAILVIDFVAGRGVSLHLYYLIPVGIAAWTLGARFGYAVALIAGVAWAFVAIASRGPSDSIGAVAWDVGATLGLYLFMAHLVTRHRRFVDGLRATARLDNETGALSRREFDRLLDAETRRSRRYRRPLALLLFDIAVARGQAPGHLAAAVRSLKAQAREVDSIARVGARRLAVLLIECKEPEPILVAERLRDVLRTNLRLGEQDLAIAIATYVGSLPTSAASFLALAEKHIGLAKGANGIAETRLD